MYANLILDEKSMVRKYFLNNVSEAAVTTDQVGLYIGVNTNAFGRRVTLF